MKNKISAVLVVYNEEAVIERALKSIYRLVDEIILVHDGYCKDKTIQIAKRYTDKIFILPHIGEAEPHRPFTYRKAAHNLILQIDADEYISKSTSQAISTILNEKKAVKSISLNWTQFFDKKKSLLGKKMIIFDKNQYYFIGAPHEWPKEKENSIGENINLNLPFYNAPQYDNLSWDVFKNKWIKWKNIHALYLCKEISEMNTWNYNFNYWDYPNKFIIQFPKLFGLPYVMASEIIKMIFSIRIGRHAFKSSLYSFIYRLMLIKKIIEIKAERRRKEIAN